MIKAMTAQDLDGLMAMLTRAYPMTMNAATIIMNHGYQNERVTTKLLYCGAKLSGALIILEEFAFLHVEQPQLACQFLPYLAGGAVSSLQGDKRLIAELATHLAHQRLWTTTVMTLPPSAYRPLAVEIDVERSQRHELEAINAMTNRIFSIDTRIDEKRQWYGIENNYLLQYVIRRQGAIVATGTWVNTHPLYGNMIGICTDDGYRGQGFAKAITHTMVQAILDYYKTPYLRFDNPVAGALYKKMGFVARDSYAILYL